MNMTLRSVLQSELRESSRPLLYVSRPSFFGVDYVINPWMEGQVDKVNREVAQLQWKNFVKVLRSLTDVQVVDCHDKKLPDVTFIANAGSFLPVDGKYTFIPASFKHPERQGEQKFFINEMKWEDVNVAKPLKQSFEGDGDLLRIRDRILVGEGHRTETEAIKALRKLVGADKEMMISMKLVDDRFYHLDTCFFYHNHENRDFIMYFPDAFDDDSRGMLRRLCLEYSMPFLEVTEREALAMSCNAVGIGNRIVGHDFSERIRTWLYTRGFFALPTPLSEFHKAGGSAKCLTLRVPRVAFA